MNKSCRACSPSTAVVTRATVPKNSAEQQPGSSLACRGLASHWQPGSTNNRPVAHRVNSCVMADGRQAVQVQAVAVRRAHHSAFPTFRRCGIPARPSHSLRAELTERALHVRVLSGTRGLPVAARLCSCTDRTAVASRSPRASPAGQGGAPRWAAGTRW